MKKNQTYKSKNYDFSNYAEEIKGDALFKINGGAEAMSPADQADMAAALRNGDTETAASIMAKYQNTETPTPPATYGNTPDSTSGVDTGNGNSETSNNNSTNTTSENHPTISIDLPTIPENIRNNPHALAYYMAKQAQAKAEGDPDKFKGYNVLGEELKGNEVYFIYVYPYDKEDQKMKAYERNSINEEVGYLIQNGVSVKVIEEGNYNDIKRALEDTNIKMLVTSGHGNSMGGIDTFDDMLLRPLHLKTMNISSSLETVIFENCYQGGKNLFTNDNEKKWEEAFGGNVNVIGWKWKTSLYETKSFNNYGLFDRQPYNLMHYCKEIVNGKN